MGSTVGDMGIAPVHVLTEQSQLLKLGLDVEKMKTDMEAVEHELTDRSQTVRDLMHKCFQLEQRTVAEKREVNIKASKQLNTCQSELHQLKKKLMIVGNQTKLKDNSGMSKNLVQDITDTIVLQQGQVEMLAN
eukprot:gene1527-12630_t